MASIFMTVSDTTKRGLLAHLTAVGRAAERPFSPRTDRDRDINTGRARAHFGVIILHQVLNGDRGRLSRLLVVEVGDRARSAARQF